MRTLKIPALQVQQRLVKPQQPLPQQFQTLARSIRYSLVCHDPALVVRYVMIAPMPSAISLNTLIEDLHNFKIARLGPVLSRKLAHALTSQVHKKSSAEVTVEDLLTYFPMRYEDRSRPALIRDLHEGVEASLELSVTNAHGYAVRNPRSYGRPQLYVFEVAGIDGPMSGREVI